MEGSFGEGKTAFVIIDMQKRFMPPGVDPEPKIQIINKVSGSFRKAGIPVILMRITGPVDCHEYVDNVGDDFLDGLDVNESDIILEKRNMNSFRDSRLKEVLTVNECKTVLISGCLSNCCIAATYFGAYDAGFLPLVLEGGIISSNTKYDDAVETICRCVTADQAIHFSAQHL